MFITPFIQSLWSWCPSVGYLRYQPNCQSSRPHLYLTFNVEGPITSLYIHNCIPISQRRPVSFVTIYSDALGQATLPQILPAVWILCAELEGFVKIDLMVSACILSDVLCHHPMIIARKKWGCRGTVALSSNEMYGTLAPETGEEGLTGVHLRMYPFYVHPLYALLPHPRTQKAPTTSVYLQKPPRGSPVIPSRRRLFTTLFFSILPASYNGSSADIGMIRDDI